jgi:pyridinium-3,5-biscarboxylic acid mononucleotide synthase
VIELEDEGRAEQAARPPSPFEGRLRELLSGVADGRVSASEAAIALRDLPFSDLGFAKVDHHRELRQGTTEIVYGRGKSGPEVAAIVERLIASNDGPVLVTRAEPQQLEAIRVLAGDAGIPVREAQRCGAIALLREVPRPTGLVVVVTGGTSDLAIAEEAVLTATVMGVEVELIADVGVAGLHRIAAHRDRLVAADAVIVLAGMEGALASVVGGLASCPVIACPTSVGYGASFGGLAALLSMLSSCAPGVVCVNIDDGVGAGYAAALIARKRADRSGAP